MAVNPLEGLMSANHPLVSSSTAEQPCAAGSPESLHGQRHSVRSSREARKWACSSRSNSGPAFGSVVQSRTLRSQNSPENAARERSRVRNLRQAFHSLQAALPSVPPDTKLSKLDVLVLATNYIAYLTETLDQEGTLAGHTLPSRPGGYLHQNSPSLSLSVSPPVSLAQLLQFLSNLLLADTFMMVRPSTQEVGRGVGLAASYRNIHRF